ncbi:hypothetical protein V2G26_008832 [Clonostachys chloroleuca]
MIIDGEKWACEACVRGHRVSNCQHSDRPLQHINKKGRPVSQCSHCRAMRKSRASHVKCDCGEKTSKCAHLQPTVEGHTETCCCNHGGRCSCAQKKDMPATLDTVPETDSEGEAHKASMSRAKPVPRRRRANTIHSSDMMMFDQNGHHKPTAKHRASQKVGPYSLNRVNSANSTSSLGAGSDSIADARRAGGSQRRVKSEAASPQMSTFAQMNGTVPPLDLSAIEYPPYIPNSSFDLFGAGFSPDQDGPMYSAGLSAASVDWSHYDLGDTKRDNFAPSSYSQAGTQSFGAFEFGSGSEQLPNLVNTTSTSGDVSEVEDFMSGPDGGDFNNAGYLRHGNMMGNQADISSIDYDSFYKNNEHGALPGAGMSMVEEDPAFWMPNYHEGIDGIVDESPDPLGPNTMGNFWEL